MSYSYLPIGLSVKNKECLVVGGGTVALRKLENLADYDTRITVVAPDVHPQIEFLAREKKITLEKRGYRSPEAAAYGLVISATDNAELNQTVFEDGKGSGALVNVVDDPAHCDFIFPAVLRRDCLTAAISTDGKAPFMSGHLRMILEELFPKHWDRLAKLAVTYRKMVLDRWGNDSTSKKACYDRFMEANWTEMFGEMNNADIEAEMKKLLETAE
jgi:siroheme synthase-like protein